MGVTTIKAPKIKLFKKLDKDEVIFYGPFILIGENRYIN